MFCKQFGIRRTDKSDIKTIRAFVTWALTTKKLKPDTVKSYLYSIQTAQALSDIGPANFVQDKCIKMLLKGAENTPTVGPAYSRQRLAMNLPLLKILGHRLTETGWDDLTIQAVWAASAVAFFTSCRMGEILSQNEKIFDEHKTLLWKHIVFEKPDILIFLPYTKTTGYKGRFLDIFELPDNDYCAVRALIELKKLTLRNSMFSMNTPVFTMHSGKFLTVKNMNKILSELLMDFADPNFMISCHSFRSAIPNFLTNHSDVFSAENIKQWGGWSSDSYKKYTRSEKNKKKSLFSKIISLM